MTLLTLKTDILIICYFSSAVAGATEKLCCSKEENFSCAFPFQYNGKTYNECTADGTVDGQLWCVTNDTIDGSWSYCKPCEDSKSTTSTSYSTTDQLTSANLITQENSKPTMSTSHLTTSKPSLDNYTPENAKTATSTSRSDTKRKPSSGDSELLSIPCSIPIPKCGETVCVLCFVLTVIVLGLSLLCPDSRICERFQKLLKSLKSERSGNSNANVKISMNPLGQNRDAADLNDTEEG